MAEELIEEQEEILEEELPLSAEEIFEQHKAEIEAAFEEKGFFRRFKEMLSGLSKPKSSAEYKLARVELHRMIAPVLAILLPTIGVVSLIVITSISGKSKETIEVEIAQAVEEEAELEEEKEQEIEPEDPPDEQVDIVVDTPVVGPVTDMVSPTTPTMEPVSVKPATQESVALIKSPVSMRSIAGSRTPGSIGAMTRGGSQYGDKETEAAVMKALRWLKKTQAADGSWPGMLSNTALAVLAYLAHGETPTSQEFGPTVERALNKLVKAQYVNPKGVVKFKGTEQRNEYAFLIVTYALCEAYGMTSNPNVKDVATKALTRIVQNQSPTGGWDYGIDKNSTRDDLSFEGWALQAIKAGKMAGLKVDGIDECIKKAMKCLKTRNFRDGGFNYTAGGRPTGLTATGCLCMQLLGYQNEPEVTAALSTMRKWLPSFTGVPNVKLSEGLPSACPQYYSYYASQCKYQAGMCQGATAQNVKAWQEWNLAMKALYPKSIITLNETIPGVDGKPKQIGYWKKDKQESHGDGDTMSTCLCALQLMVYYRYLPTSKIENSASKSSDKDDANKKKVKQEVEVEVDI